MYTLLQPLIQFNLCSFLRTNETKVNQIVYTCQVTIYCYMLNYICLPIFSLLDRFANSEGMNIAMNKFHITGVEVFVSTLAI